MFGNNSPSSDYVQGKGLFLRVTQPATYAQSQPGNLQALPSPFNPSFRAHSLSEQHRWPQVEQGENLISSLILDQIMDP